MKLENVIVIYMKYRTREHHKTLKVIKETFREFDIKASFVYRGDISHQHFRNKDLIIAVGGDGTFIRVGHHIKDGSPILGVNSDPNRKEGFFLRANRKNFRNRLMRLMKGNYKIISLLRLQAKVGRIWTEPAVNEIFFGHVKSYRMVRYDVKVRGKEEFQKSSGFIASTGAGSHAWVLAAGGKRMKIDSNKIQYRTREPHHGKLTRQSLTKGFLNRNEEILITPKTRSGVIVIDSLSKEYFTKVDKPVTIKSSDISLEMISF